MIRAELESWLDDKFSAGKPIVFGMNAEYLQVDLRVFC
jgi:hypothetical protein